MLDAVHLIAALVHDLFCICEIKWKEQKKCQMLKIFWQNTTFKFRLIHSTFAHYYHSNKIFVSICYLFFYGGLIFAVENKFLRIYLYEFKSPTKLNFKRIYCRFKVTLFLSCIHILKNWIASAIQQQTNTKRVQRQKKHWSKKGKQLSNETVEIT